MKLLKVSVHHFRNILDSGEVDIQEDVTCLVGKNESGKTAFLEALRRLNPAQAEVPFNITRHYPAWLEKRHRMAGKDLSEVRPVRATFSVEDNDRSALEERFGKGVLKSDLITLCRSYGGTVYYGYEADEKKAVAHVIKNADLPGEAKNAANSAENFEGLLAVIEELKGRSGEEL